jgi:hypothetical protein
MGIIAVPNPNHEGGSAVTRSFRTGGEKHADSFSVARVRPRTSKGITDLLLLTVTRLDAACPSKKSCDGRENEADRRGANATLRPASTRREKKAPPLEAETPSNDTSLPTRLDETESKTPTLIPANSEPKIQ